MRVAIVHDDLFQWGGAERVLVGISEVFPDAPIYTSVFDSKNQFLAEKFKNKETITSFVQKIPFWKYLYKALLPLYPIAFEQFDFSQFDLVISHTTRFAKSIITKPETTHISYIHTPPRFLWNFSSEKPNKFLDIFFSKLRIYDVISAKRVDHFLAGSKNAQGRIKKIYNEPSEVLYPFVDLDIFNVNKSFNGGYFLVIARLNKYKKVDVVVKTFNQLEEKLKIVGVGPELSHLKSIGNKNIEFISKISDQLIVNLIAGCKGIIIPGEEDFGMGSIEAQAMGKPVIAFKKGGVLETVEENKTGVFFDEQVKESLVMALNKFRSLKFDPDYIRKNAERFSKDKFKEKLKTLVGKLIA